MRYNSVEQIISDIDITLKSLSEVQDKTDTINKILNSQYDTQVHEYIMDLVASDKLSKFIVANKLSSLWEIVIQFESVY
ncbi:MAG: hypothetical protein ACK5JH_13120 [Anaerocolumna sp.]